MGHSYIALVDQLVVSGSNFIGSILLARWIGVDDFGSYSLILMLVLFTSTINFSLITQPLLSCAYDYNNKKEYYGNAIIAQIILSSCLAVVCTVIFSLYMTAVKMRIDYVHTAPIIFLVFSYNVQDSIRRLLFANKQSIQALKCDILNYAGRIFLLLVFFELELVNLVSVLWILIFFNSLAFCYGYIISEFRGIWRLKSISVIFQNHWSFSKWLLGSALLQWFTGNTFVLIAASIIGPSVVAVVRITQNLMGLVHVIFLAMENFVPIMLSEKLRTANSSEVVFALGKILMVLLLLVVVNISILSFYSVEILTFIYGVQYTVYSSFFENYILVYLILPFNIVLKLYFRTIKFTKSIFWADLISVFFSITCANYFIITYNENGLILGTIISSLIVTSILIAASFSLSLSKRF